MEHQRQPYYHSHYYYYYYQHLRSLCKFLGNPLKVSMPFLGSPQLHLIGCQPLPTKSISTHHVNGNDEINWPWAREILKLSNSDDRLDSDPHPIFWI